MRTLRSSIRPSPKATGTATKTTEPRHTPKGYARRSRRSSRLFSSKIDRHAAAPSMVTVSLRVRGCNIRGGMFTKLRQSPLASLVHESDVLLLQETHLREGEGDAIQRYCSTHEIISNPRPLRTDMKRPGGGVATLIRKGIQFKKMEDLSSTDILTIEAGGILLMNIYVPPEGSTAIWPEDRESPMQLAADLISLARQRSLPLLILGDWNARTGNMSPTLDHPKRISVDMTVNSRGRELLRIAGAEELQILNGTQGGDAGVGHLTCFHSMGSSVVDYALISKEHISMISHFEVRKPVSPWTDHACLAVTATPTQHPVTTNRAKPPKKSSCSEVKQEAPSTTLDTLLSQAMSSIPSLTQRLATVYGPVTSTAYDLSTVYIASKKGRNRCGLMAAAAGVFWRANSSRNLSHRINGPQNSERALLIGLLHALKTSDPVKPLKVYCTSQSLIHLVKDRCTSPDFDANSHQNADVLIPVITVITQRMAQLILVVLDTAKLNLGYLQASRLATDGIMESALPAPTPTTNDYGAFLPREWTGCLPAPRLIPGAPKIVISGYEDNCVASTNNPRKSGAMRKPHTAADRGRRAHRKRSSAARIRSANKKLLSEASPGGFWRTVRKLRNSGSTDTPLPLQTIADEFEDRMQGKTRDISNFDLDQMELARIRDNEIPPMTRDPSESRCFSRPFTCEEGRSVVMAQDDSYRYSEGKAPIRQTIQLQNYRTGKLFSKTFHPPDRRQIQGMVLGKGLPTPNTEWLPPRLQDK
ncbi:hypothetical protein M407DRAFT_11652 [Tulasnella calospora MUT 4182]|uniref:Endonuclease/exonuclease/phosphatase domain-containing protein n=1 Tax=Tulasnella calospora MUT 4182 TaxID=1051891 RepID=A0A0C3KBU7_9AGAM|nr:hypothetical protein M407DRAFT_11652 [Tulasnella calospora MUT 4182]